MHLFLLLFLSSSSSSLLTSSSQLASNQNHELTIPFHPSFRLLRAECTQRSLRNAEKIVIVPGYGLAVAQAAGVVAEIALKLRKEGKDVKFAVHPVVSTSEKSSVTPCGADSLSVCTYLRYLSYISCIFVLIRRAECLDS
jgi:hypothetical protein